AMVRAAAKNHASVAVVVDPAAYGDVLAALAEGGFDEERRKRLAAQAFAHTASYDAAVASWFAGSYAPDGTAEQTGWPAFHGQAYERVATLRYGENPHQGAALYAAADPAGPGLAGAEPLHGRAMSYDHYVDGDGLGRAPCRGCVQKRRVW